MQIPQIVPSGHACGAEVVGVDLSAPGPLTTEALREALREHLAVVVRGRLLSDEYLLALGGIFGTPEMQGVSVLNQQSGDVRQEHLVVSNRMTLERPTGTRGRGDPLWQTELSYRMRPCSIALLHVLEVPAAGGDIAFANQYLAYERLPEDLRARIDGRMLLHDESRLDDGRLRKGHDRSDRSARSDRRPAPHCAHPSRIAAQGLVSGAAAQRLDHRPAAGGERSGCSTRCGRRRRSRSAWVWTHHWQAGDTLIWDNRCLVHRQAHGRRRRGLADPSRADPRRSAAMKPPARAD